jgi:hypothetical protein
MALSSALGSNPGLDLTQPANLKLIKSQIGMDKQDAALGIISPNPNTHKSFKARYYQQHDPRAFAINTMSPEEIEDLHKTLKGSERDKFNRSLQTAVKAGLVSPPSQGQLAQRTGICGFARLSAKQMVILARRLWLMSLRIGYGIAEIAPQMSF